MARSTNASDLIRYLSEGNGRESGKLPSLQDLSNELEMSVPRLREQLEVAKAFGFVEVRPRIGIRTLPYSFYPPVFQSLSFAIKQDRGHFDSFSDLRNQIEAAYWMEAVEMLNQEDLDALDALVKRAWDKLLSDPIRIPHREHRELHMVLFQRLENPFVLGILEAYWDAYEAVGLNLYTDYEYLKSVWNYHTRMIDAIRQGDLQTGYQALIDHKDLLRHHPFVLSSEPKRESQPSS